MGVPYLPVTGRPVPFEKDGCLLCLSFGQVSEFLPLRSFPVTDSRLLSSYLSFSGETGMWQMTWKWLYRNGEVQKGMEAGLLLNVRRKSNGFSLVKSLLYGSEKKAATCFCLSGCPGWTQPLPSALPHREPGSQKLGLTHTPHRLWDSGCFGKYAWLLTWVGKK